jgi:hypothetical protein
MRQPYWSFGSEHSRCVRRAEGGRLPACGARAVQLAAANVSTPREFAFKSGREEGSS